MHPCWNGKREKRREASRGVDGEWFVLIRFATIRLLQNPTNRYVRCRSARFSHPPQFTIGHRYEKVRGTCGPRAPRRSLLHSRVFWAAVFLADFIRGSTPPVAGGEGLLSEPLNTRII